MTEDDVLLAWLRAALVAVRSTAEALERSGECLATVSGIPAASLSARTLLDGVAADAAILEEHTTGGVAQCSRCLRLIDDAGTPRAFVGICPTLRFVATRYRHAVPGWRGEWAS